MSIDIFRITSGSQHPLGVGSSRLFALIFAYKIEQVENETYRSKFNPLEFEERCKRVVQPVLDILQKSSGTEKEDRGEVYKDTDKNLNAETNENSAVPSEIPEDSPLEKMKKLREKYEKEEQEKLSNQQN